MLQIKKKNVERKFMNISGIMVLIFVVSIGMISLAQISKESIIIEVSASPSKGADEGEIIEVKRLTGQVVGFFPRNDPKFIGVAFDSQNTDYYFILDENVEVVHKNSLSEIVIGDTVEVTFDKTTKKTEEGEEQREQRAKTLRFIRPKSTSGVLTSK